MVTVSAPIGVARGQNDNRARRALSIQGSRGRPGICEASQDEPGRGRSVNPHRQWPGAAVRFSWKEKIARGHACMKASALIAKCLENEGVRYVFGLPGEEVLDILDSLVDSQIVFIPTRHEQGAAFMADAYGRLTGRPGVCLSTLGPGATNLATGVADANL